jgi:hypothetical protein
MNIQKLKNLVEYALANAKEPNFKEIFNDKLSSEGERYPNFLKALEDDLKKVLPKTEVKGEDIYTLLTLFQAFTLRDWDVLKKIPERLRNKLPHATKSSLEEYPTVSKVLRT